MSDESEEREPTADEILDDAINLVQESIENLLSLMGEDDDSLLTDWLVVAVSQGYTDDGRPTASDAIILPKRWLPGYRIKGLLVDALDQYRASEQQVIMFNSAEDGDEEE